MSIFDELFNPSARFREEEKRRLEWMRDEEGEGDPYRGPIDLGSGTVRIKVPAADEVEAADDPRTDDTRADGPLKDSGPSAI